MLNILHQCVLLVLSVTVMVHGSKVSRIQNFLSIVTINKATTFGDLPGHPACILKC